MLTANQIVLVNWSLLTVFSEDCQTSENCKQSLPLVKGPFKVPYLRNDVLTFDGNEIFKTKSICRAIHFGILRCHRSANDKRSRCSTIDLLATKRTDAVFENIFGYR